MSNSPLFTRELVRQKNKWQNSGKKHCRLVERSKEMGVNAIFFACCETF